jgi:type I restriction enzyme R subunit
LLTFIYNLKALNQNPEQLARDRIDADLNRCGWVIQGKNKINLKVSLGVAVREYQTDIGPADYVLFADGKPIDIIEAKRAEEAVHLTMHEDQSEGYATAKLKYLHNEKLRFVYESTGEVTRFTNYRDIKPRSRSVFSFHRPETLLEYSRQGKSLRTRIQDIPALPTSGLRDCQIVAIDNVEQSFKDARPKALIQMATGSGKTFTAITFIYRLLKYAKAKRILFFVDTKNLGEQADQEMMAYVPNDDNRKFTELYDVTRLKSSGIPNDSQVYISTIQRMYSILKGTELDESAEEQNPNERFQPKEPLPVVYTEKVPIEFFDFIVIDECHRSIYNLWKQVLDYFDVFQIGLTATPDNRTFGYFNKNVVSDYGYEKAVIDVVLAEGKLTNENVNEGDMPEGWKMEKLGKVSQCILCKMLDKKNLGVLKPYLRYINGRWNGFKLDDIFDMRFQESEDERFGILKGDLIICEGGEPGRAAIWKGQIPNMKIQKALHRVRFNKQAYTEYFLYYFI